jgi:hypothetical protein
MLIPQSNLYHVVKVTWRDATGEHDGGEERIHVSRQCDNQCAHYDPGESDEWSASEHGPCMNLVYPAGPGLFCSSHQTQAEFNADCHRAHTPVLVLVEGGAA